MEIQSNAVVAGVNWICLILHLSDVTDLLQYAKDLITWSSLLLVLSVGNCATSVKRQGRSNMSGPPN